MFPWLFAPAGHMQADAEPAGPGRAFVCATSAYKSNTVSSCMGVRPTPVSRTLMTPPQNHASLLQPRTSEVRKKSVVPLERSPLQEGECGSRTVITVAASCRPSVRCRTQSFVATAPWHSSCKALSEFQADCRHRSNAMTRTPTRRIDSKANTPPDGTGQRGGVPHAPLAEPSRHERMHPRSAE
jgi:hypothetical protein